MRCAIWRKNEITKVIRLGKKQADGDTGDTEQNPDL